MLTANRNTLSLAGLGSWPVTFTVKDLAILFAGAMLAKDATPEAVPASDTAGLIFLGRCPEYIDNTDDGELVCPEFGIFGWSNDASNPVLATDLVVYVKTDDSVCASAGSTNKVVGGLLVAIDGDKVWVCQTLEAIRAAQALHDLSAASAGAHIADVAAVTQDLLTLTNMTGTANTAPAAETNIDALTVTAMTGTANTAPAADTVPTKLTGTLTGATDGAIADIAADTPACAGNATPSATQVDAAINKAVATIVTGTNLQLKELQTSLAAVIDLNTVLVNNCKTFATELNLQRVLNTVFVNNAKTFATELNAARADNAAQVTKINEIFARLESQGISLTV